ncbi:hypothetical protein N7520_012001 [Penicillium odoratum]|uniref:uncharacterized protein n=1 Tax=Penicillium odoratum TaxID=1167516 RepID=UPI002549466C|nr:uncharacterized protein N7520_012001 [Penicillium odoratum]KAJ5746819.1 hypothetical protein N7520_012001 [Penicillium odoratum]
MDQLPLEIKHIIAQWADENKSKESLQALSKVNRQWNKIASSVLYRNLVIRLNSQGEIPRKLLLPPDTRSVLTHVKTLSLVAELVPPKPGVRGTDDIPHVLERLRLGELDNPAFHRVGRYGKGDWTFIADFIRQIPSLQNANLLIQNGGPVELFEVLSDYHPTCRVSIFTSWPFPSRGSYQVINKHWALSPMLHAVHVSDYSKEMSRPGLTHSDYLLKKLILQSPQIKEASLQTTTNPYGGMRPHDPKHNQGLLVEDGSLNKTPTGKLQRLIWPLKSKMTAEQFKEWQMVTDFSLLESWTIGCVEDSALLQTIADIHPFQQLTRLTLALVAPKGDVDDTLEFWRAAESTFHSLPPLTYLWLLGSFKPAFFNRGVLAKHGLTLLELRLYTGPGVIQDINTLSYTLEGQIAPAFSSDDISELAGQCPSLQKLFICAQRSQDLGTDVWNALGRFPSLQELDLTLKCSPEMDANMMPVPPRELSEFEKGVLVEYRASCRRWFIRDCIINCSINESLAKAYFTHIRACQDEKRFAQLVLRPLYNTVPGRDYFNHLALTWTIELSALTGLHAKCKKTSESRVPTLETSFGAEMISIFRSI